MRILLYLLAYTVLTYGKIKIKDASIATLSRGDVGMIFYVTLENTDQDIFRIYLKMIKCCEEITPTDKDTTYMTLIGGDMGILNAKCSKNITMLYPNMYLHNRKGECTISVVHLNEQKQAFEARQVISFNTMISNDKPPPVLRDYYTPKEIKKCDTLDLDPLENCQPVNCLMKYLGTRNYFNHKWNRCQKVPMCIADPEKELPDVAYIPVSNKCRDLEQALGKNDLTYLQEGKVDGCWDKSNFPFVMANIRCHHGKIDNETGFCVCDDGWMSAPFDKDQYEPSLSVYHMCSIEVATWNGVNKTKVKMTFLIISITAVSVAMVILILSFCMNLMYKFIRSFESEECVPMTCPTYYKAKPRKDKSEEGSVRSEKKFFGSSIFSKKEKSKSDTKATTKRSIIKKKSNSGEQTVPETSSAHTKEVQIMDAMTTESARSEPESEIEIKSPKAANKTSKTKSSHK